MSGAGAWDRRRILIIFALHAFAGCAPFTRIPDIQAGLKLSEGELGLVLTGQPIGALFMFLFASRLVEALGTRAMLAFALPVMAVAPFLIAIVPSAIIATALMAIYGAGYALSNVTMNVEADRVEAATGQRLMIACHGIWSLAFLSTALLGTLARGLGVSPALHLGLIVPPVLLALAIVLVRLRPQPERAHKGKTGSRIVLPTRATLLLVGYGLASALLEGGSRLWSVIYMRDSFAVADWVETLTLPALLLAMSACRLVSDRLIERFGPRRVALLFNLVGIAGLGLVVLAPLPVVALCGFALIGIGASVAFPLMLSAAAAIGDRPASENVAAVTLMIQLLTLGAPTILGLIADHFGVRAIFLALLPSVLLSIALVRVLEPRRG